LQLSYKDALRRAYEKWKDMSKMERRPFLHLASLESIRYKSEVDNVTSKQGVSDLNSFDTGPDPAF
jgi:hypothetical protein